MDLNQEIHIKIDGFEEGILNRDLNDGDVPAIINRTNDTIAKINSGMPKHQAERERIEDIINGTIGNDRTNVKTWLTNLANNL